MNNQHTNKQTEKKQNDLTRPQAPSDNKKGPNKDRAEHIRINQDEKGWKM